MHGITSFDSGSVMDSELNVHEQQRIEAAREAVDEPGVGQERPRCYRNTNSVISSRWTKPVYREKNAE